MKSKQKKNNSLSQGYLKLSGLLLFTGILITGVVMVCSAVTSFADTEKNALRQSCETLASNISATYTHQNDTPEGEEWRNFDFDAVRELMQTTKKECNLHGLILYEKGGGMIYGTYSESEVPYLATPAVRAHLVTDDYSEIGYYTNDAVDPQLCCVIPFSLEENKISTDTSTDNPEEQEMQETVRLQFYLGAVTDASSLTDYTIMLVRNLVVCLLISILVFMVLFRLGAGQLDKQFEEITQVAGQYAEGEFSARVSLPEQASLYALGCTLNRMAEFIEQNENTRRNFVANVSHELRTPMTTIGGFADGILDGTIPPEQHKKYIKIIDDEIHRLKTLVNSMLNLTKFESGEMQIRFENLDIAQLLIRTVLMFEKRITNKNVDVEGLEDISLMVKADKDLMFQVLYNLIENAVKFVNEDGIISFSVHEENGKAYIMVKNTGEGLANDELPKIFDRFYKTDTSRSQDKTGLGLGLSIARKIVHLHGGHIVVKSVKGEYTAFEVQIPVNGA